MAQKRKKTMGNVLGELKKQTKIAEDHLDHDKESSKKMISLTRFQIVIGVVAFFVTTGIFSVLINLLYLPSATPDYAVDVKVVPDTVLLNDRMAKDFTFIITNVGKKNISDFHIKSVDLYRMQINKLVYKWNVARNREYMRCFGNRYAGGGSNSFHLDVGKTCELKVEMHGDACSDCFDDDDKLLEFYLYFGSAPPIENKRVELKVS